MLIFNVHMQVIEMSPSSYIGYQLKHEAFHGARCYDEATEAFKTMLSKLDNAPETQIRSKSQPIHTSKCLTLSPELREQYLSPSEVDSAIRKGIHVQMENTPLRLLNT